MTQNLLKKGDDMSLQIKEWMNHKTTVSKVTQYQVSPNQFAETIEFVIASNKKPP